MNANSSSSLIQQWFDLNDDREVLHEARGAHPVTRWLKLHLHH
jgi:hypothetical protein